MYSGVHCKRETLQMVSKLDTVASGKLFCTQLHCKQGEFTGQERDVKLRFHLCFVLEAVVEKLRVKFEL